MDRLPGQTEAEKGITDMFSKYAVDFTEEFTFETEQDFLYISDPNTYELYYISIAEGRPIPAGWQNYQGKTCYEVLQQRDSPCPFCTNRLLNAEQYYVWEHYNEITGRNYILKDKLLDWHGKRVRLEIVMDITGEERAKAVLLGSLESQGVLMNCVEALAAGTGTATALQGILRMIGTFYHAGWAYLHYFTHQDAQGVVLHWQGDPSAAPVQPLLKDPAPRVLEQWAAIFSDNRQSVLWDTEGLRADNPLLYACLRWQGVRNACFTPIFVGERLAGLVCLYNITAHWKELSILNPLAKYISGQIGRDEVEQRNRRLMYYDEVTGYQNFEWYRRRAAEILAANPDTPYALWYCDLKNFKYINDVFGYDVGNRILRYWANLIADDLDEGEAFARISADNFTALRRYRGMGQVESMFFGLVERLATFQEAADRRFRLELASGVYLMRQPADRLSLDEMMNRANMAQKSVKNKSGSRYAVYSDGMRARVLRDMQMQGEMQEALRRGEFILHLQPQVALTVEGYQAPDYAEALVRWQKREGALIMPGEFIGLFERNGMIVELDRYVFEQACRYLRDVRGRRSRPLCLAVNVSRISMLQPDFIEAYCRVKDRYGIRPGEVELEFTENIAVENYEQFRDIILSLHRNGVGCAMDDFGTGQSSLNVLKNLPISVLKLDRQFFAPADDPARGWAVISCVLELARKLGMNTVAEGIESTEQVRTLRGMGCKYVQGFIFSKPLPPEAFESFDWLQAEKL